MPRPSSATRVLDAALDLLRSGGTVTIDSVAVAAGLTKPGVIYHFPTKEALMDALLDHRMEQCAADLERFAGGPLDTVDATARHLAYLEWSLTGEFDAADLVVTADPRLRDHLAERWAAHVDPWFAVPRSVPAATRHRLLAVRLLADGAWFDQACGLTTLSLTERRAVRAIAHDLLEVPA